MKYDFFLRHVTVILFSISLELDKPFEFSEDSKFYTKHHRGTHRGGPHCWGLEESWAL